METTMLDEKDKRILAVLENDSRKKVVDIAEELGIPRATIHDRLKRLETEQIIKRYTIIKNHKKIGDATTAYIFIAYDPSSGATQKDVAEKLSQFPEVKEVHIVSGEWDIILKVRASKAEEIGSLVVERIREIKGVGRTITSSTIMTMKEEL
jgi:Lrp/AsnC family transcriptional regulator, leucine-responsive regulatory protein